MKTKFAYDRYQIATIVSTPSCFIEGVSGTFYSKNRYVVKDGGIYYYHNDILVFVEFKK